MAKLIDGKKISKDILEELKITIEQKKLTPKLAIVLVGEDPASLTYVNQKQKRGEEIGVEVEIHSFSDHVSGQEIEQKIRVLNEDMEVTGIIVQLPLPPTLNKTELLNLIARQKDVDGLREDSLFKPATPLGIMELLKRSQVEIKGKKVVVMGQSDLVGLPVADMLKVAGGEVEVVDINTPHPQSITREADILVVAIGQPEFVKKEMVKKGVVVVDVGTNLTEGGLVGDVDPEVFEVAYQITPVPGGVGPMTVAMLLKNVVASALSKP